MQMRALLFVAILTTGITNAMEKVEKEIATALDLRGASYCSCLACHAVVQIVE